MMSTGQVLARSLCLRLWLGLSAHSGWRAQCPSQRLLHHPYLGPVHTAPVPASAGGRALTQLGGVGEGRLTPLGCGQWRGGHPAVYRQVVFGFLHCRLRLHFPTPSSVSACCRASCPVFCPSGAEGWQPLLLQGGWGGAGCRGVCSLPSFSQHPALLTFRERAVWPF